MQRLAIRTKYIPYLFLILFAVGMGTLNSYIFMLLVISTLLLSKDKRLILNSEFCVLLLCFLIFYFLYNTYYEQGIVLYTIITVCIGPIAGFCLGQLLVTSEKSIQEIICICCIGLLFHGILNLWYAPTASIWYDQNIPDFWTGDKVTATLNGAYFTGAIVLCCFFYNKRKFKSRMLSIALVGIMLWSSLKTAERTLILNFALSIIVFTYGTIFFGKKREEKLIKVLKYTGIICAVILVFTMLFLNDFMGIQTAFFKTSLGSRLNMLDTIMQDGRNEAVGVVLKALWEHPMGGFKNTLFYAHNLIVDTGRMCGVIPMLLLLLYIVLILIKLFKVCRNHNISLEARMLVLVFYFSYLVNFMVEPVLEGMPMIFVTFCIVNGAVAKLNNLAMLNGEKIG